MSDKDAVIEFSLGLTLFHISMIFTLFVLIISFKLRFYTKFSTELIIYVLISESLYSLSKLLFFIKTEKDTFEHKVKVNLILALTLYFESVTLISILVHTIKIYDAIIRESQWFIKRKWRICFRISIFTFALVRTSLLISIYLIYEKEIKCTELFCTLSGNLRLSSFIIDVIVFIAMFAIIFYSYFYLKKSLSAKHYHSQAMTKKIERMTCKVWLFPIAAFIYWITQVIWEMVVFFNEKHLSVTIIKTIIRSCSAALYAVLLIYTQDNLKLEIKRKLCCCLKYNENNSFLSSDNEDTIELPHDLMGEE